MQPVNQSTSPAEPPALNAEQLSNTEPSALEASCENPQPSVTPGWPHALVRAVPKLSALALTLAAIDLKDILLGSTGGTLHH